MACLSHNVWGFSRPMSFDKSVFSRASHNASHNNIMRRAGECSTCFSDSDSPASHNKHMVCVFRLIIVCCVYASIVQSRCPFPTRDNSEEGGAAGRGCGQKAVGGRLAVPREGSWRKLERARRGRGLGVSLNPSASIPPSAEISHTRPQILTTLLAKLTS